MRAFGNCISQLGGWGRVFDAPGRKIWGVDNSAQAPTEVGRGSHIWMTRQPALPIAVMAQDI
jgi:hypothetical protein